MQQQVKLGTRLRKRYVTEMGFLSPNFTTKEIHLYSTDVDRTLLSAAVNSIGLFVDSQEISDYHPNISTWPKGYVPVPVHTAGRKKEEVSRGKG